jgi:hypothetical protein
LEARTGKGASTTFERPHAARLVIEQNKNNSLDVVETRSGKMSVRSLLGSLAELACLGAFSVAVVAWAMAFGPA